MRTFQPRKKKKRVSMVHRERGSEEGKDSKAKGKTSRCNGAGFTSPRERTRREHYRPHNDRESSGGRKEQGEQKRKKDATI